MAEVNISLPADGQTADVADYNTPLNTLVNDYNGNIDNSNIATAAAIAGSKLADDSVTPNKLSTGAAGVVNAATGTTTSTSYTATLSGTPGTNPEVTVTVGANGLLLVGWGSQTSNSGANNNFVSVALSGANTVASTDDYAEIGGQEARAFGRTVLLTGLTAGSTTVTMQYRTTAGTLTVLRRNLWALPL